MEQLLLMGCELCRTNEDFWLAPGCAVNKVEFCGFPLIAAIFKALKCTQDKWMIGWRGWMKKESVFLMKNEGRDKPWNK